MRLGRMCVGWVQDEVPGGRRLPSRFMLRTVLLIWMASAALLCTVVPSQLIQWLVFWTWTMMPFLGSPLTAWLCSLNLTFSVLLISPTYTCEQSFRESYICTTPVCFCSVVLVFSCISSLFRVVIGLKKGFTPSGAQTLLIFLLSPLM